jgi:hypothetical protein
MHFLWEQCMTVMQSKVEPGSRSESDIKGNPIELLKIIKQHALNYHKHQYEMAIIFESFQTLAGLKQKDSESLNEYTKWFKTSKRCITTANRHAEGAEKVYYYNDRLQSRCGKSVVMCRTSIPVTTCIHVPGQ